MPLDEERNIAHYFEIKKCQHVAYFKIKRNHFLN